MWLLVLSVFLFLSGAYLFVALGLGAALVSIFVLDLPPLALAQLMFRRIITYPLLAIPLFMLAGSLLFNSGATRRLVDFFDSILGRLPGGLLITSVAFCVFFGAMTGSGYATIAAIGTIMLPEMKRAGYSDTLRGGVVATAGQLGNLIPPSITMIVIGSLMEKSVATLFAAGLVPGLLIGAGTAVVGSFLAAKQHVETKPGASWRTRGITFVKAFPVILMPLIILGGIYTGKFTPTEAAAVACIIATLLGFFVYRGLSWQSFKASLEFATKNSVMIFMIMLTVSAFAYTISRSGLAIDMVYFALGRGFSGFGVVLMLMVMMVGLGFFINPLSLMYLALPILVPMSDILGINLIWLGVLWEMNSLIGAMTPPMAAALYVAARVADMEPTRLFKGTLPFLGVWVAVLILAVVVPEIILWFPRLMGLRL